MSDEQKQAPDEEQGSSEQTGAAPAADEQTNDTSSSSTTSDSPQKEAGKAEWVNPQETQSQGTPEADDMADDETKLPLKPAEGSVFPNEPEQQESTGTDETASGQGKPETSNGITAPSGYTSSYAPDARVDRASDPTSDPVARANSPSVEGSTLIAPNDYPDNLALQPYTIAKTIPRTVGFRAMTRAEYNIYRGWQLPADENGDDKGFIIQDTETGYVNWLPEDQFNHRYYQVSTETSSGIQKNNPFNGLHGTDNEVWNQLWNDATETSPEEIALAMQKIKDSNEASDKIKHYKNEGIYGLMSEEGKFEQQLRFAEDVTDEEAKQRGLNITKTSEHPGVFHIDGVLVATVVEVAMNRVSSLPGTKGRAIATALLASAVKLLKILKV